MVTLRCTRCLSTCEATKYVEADVNWIEYDTPERGKWDLTSVAESEENDWPLAAECDHEDYEEDD